MLQFTAVGAKASIFSGIHLYHQFYAFCRGSTMWQSICWIRI